jgi:uncharacterized membrane protein
MRRWLLFSALLLALAVAASLLVWANRSTWLPEKVPTHWGPSGDPDAWVARDHMLPHLLLMPGVMVLVLAMWMVLPWLSPVRYKIEPFRPTYDYIMGLLMALFGYLHAVILLGYTESVTRVDRWITGGSLVAIAALGNVLGKVRPNFWIGVRTPWTLASETVWTRTHRLAAQLFVAGGVAGLVLLLAGVHPLIALSVFGVAAITPVFYSLWLYKRLEKQGRLGEPG